MDPVFANAFLLKQPPLCLGRRLLPLSLGHSLVLESINSPLLGHTLSPQPSALSPQPSPGDLAVAVYVCSQLATNLSRTLDFAQEAAQFRAWGEKTTLEDATSDLVLFRAYMGVYLEAPERWQPEARGAGPKAPWQYIVVNALRQHLKLSYDEAWNCPVNRALADYAALGEALGDDSLMSEEEKQASDDPQPGAPESVGRVSDPAPPSDSSSAPGDPHA